MLPAEAAPLQQLKWQARRCVSSTGRCAIQRLARLQRLINTTLRAANDRWQLTEPAHYLG